jgi:hypothetical protein
VFVSVKLFKPICLLILDVVVKDNERKKFFRFGAWLLKLRAKKSSSPLPELAIAQKPEIKLG